jgi:hypothetical protein
MGCKDEYRILTVHCRCHWLLSLFCCNQCRQWYWMTWTCLMLQLTCRRHSPFWQWAGWGFNNSQCKWQPSHKWFHLQWNKGGEYCRFLYKGTANTTNKNHWGQRQTSFCWESTSWTTLLALSIGTLTFHMPKDSLHDQDNSQMLTHSKGPKMCWLYVQSKQWASNPGGQKEFKTKTRSK